MTGEDIVDQRAKVVAAAHAAASWVRARQATWSDEPMGGLPAAAPPSTKTPPPGRRRAEPGNNARRRARDRDAEAAAAGPIAQGIEELLREASSAASIAPESAAPPRARITESASQRLRTLARLLREAPGRPVVRWVLALVAAAALVAATVVAARRIPPTWTFAHFSELSQGLQLPQLPALPALPKLPGSTGEVATPIQPPPPTVTKTTGGILILSSPPGARVLVDGVVRGATPLHVDDVAAGRHLVVLESPSGIVQRSVNVTAQNVTEVNESIFEAFVAIYSPFELSISEGTRALRPDDRSQIMLPAGPHDLLLTNRALGFTETRHIDLTPGQTLNISVAPPKSTVSVTSSEPAEVWVDGASVGQTPLTNVVVDLGTHEIVVKRPDGGERRLTATVTTKPFALYVDFSK